MSPTGRANRPGRAVVDDMFEGPVSNPEQMDRRSAERREVLLNQGTAVGILLEVPLAVGVKGGPAFWCLTGGGGGSSPLLPSPDYPIMDDADPPDSLDLLWEPSYP